MTDFGGPNSRQGSSLGRNAPRTGQLRQGVHEKVNAYVVGGCFRAVGEKVECV